MLTEYGLPKAGLWKTRPVEPALTPLQAFEAMRRFLAQFNEREPAERKETIEQILRWTEIEADGGTADPAQWHDWTDAVDSVLDQRVPGAALLQGLPDEVRSNAVVLPSGEVMWARPDAQAALHGIAAAGGQILGLDLRSDGPGSTPGPGVATEIPWADCSSSTADDALGVALTALLSAGGDYPEHPWVLVPWKPSPLLPQPG
jgi:hypothetical protein